MYHASLSRWFTSTHGAAESNACDFILNLKKHGTRPCRWSNSSCILSCAADRKKPKTIFIKNCFRDELLTGVVTHSPGHRWIILPSVVAAKGKGSGGVKTAKLYAWVALQTLPEEMVISPCLLDFLEKALETIPITPVERNYAGVFVVPTELDEPSSLVIQYINAYSSCVCVFSISYGFPRGRHGSVWYGAAGGIHHLSGFLVHISILLLPCWCGCVRQSPGTDNSTVILFFLLK